MNRDRLLAMLHKARDEMIEKDVNGWPNAVMAAIEALSTPKVEAGERDLIQWAHDTLYEINPSNYDHDEVCKLNDASVAVILGLAQYLGERHGKTDEWWADYQANIASPAITDEAVERAAKAIHDGPLGANDEEDFGDNTASDWCREVARAALIAAFPPAVPAEDAVERVQQGMQRGFMTCVSDNPTYYVKIAFRTLKEAQDFHAALLAAFPSRGEKE